MTTCKRPVAIEASIAANVAIASIDTSTVRILSLAAAASTQATLAALMSRNAHVRESWVAGAAPARRACAIVGQPCDQLDLPLGERRATAASRSQARSAERVHRHAPLLEQRLACARRGLEAGDGGDGRLRLRPSHDRGHDVVESGGDDDPDDVRVAEEAPGRILRPAGVQHVVNELECCRVATIKYAGPTAAPAMSSGVSPRCSAIWQWPVQMPRTRERRSPGVRSARASGRASRF